MGVSFIEPTCMIAEWRYIDLKIRKRIAVLPDLHVKIYIDYKIMSLTEFIVITSMEQFAALLKKFDEI